jgi:hypothetical protein
LLASTFWLNAVPSGKPFVDLGEARRGGIIERSAARLNMAW